MRGRERELMELAFADLAALGLQVSFPPDHGYGNHVRILSKPNAEHFSALIQTRSHDPRSSRYLIGIVVPDLRRVDGFIAWFENERCIYIIPAENLAGILDERIALGDARYSYGNRQWRVDFHIDENTISPQGSDGRRYPIDDFRLDIPRMAPA